MDQSNSIGLIQHHIYQVRGQRVMMDEDLAPIYGVTTKRLNEQTKRNRLRFPADFMFRLTEAETAEIMRLRNGKAHLKSQIATSSLPQWGGRRKLPYAFTEHGAVMLACVLRSPTQRFVADVESERMAYERHDRNSSVGQRRMGCSGLAPEGAQRAD